MYGSLYLWCLNILPLNLLDFYGYTIAHAYVFLTL